MKLGRTVAELSATLSEHELAEWMAYYSLEPWGEDRADLRAGVIASAVYNAQGAKKRGGGQFAPADFLLFPERRDDPNSARNVKAKLLAAFGGKVKKADDAGQD